MEWARARPPPISRAITRVSVSGRCSAISIGNSRRFRGSRYDRNSRHALNHGIVAINIRRGLPSIFDIFATQTFLAKLAERGTLSDAGKVGVLGMRVDERTRAAEQLHRFVEGLGLPVVGYLRDTQNYVYLAAQGLTLWDVAPSRVAKDREQWQPLLAWLEE